MITPDTNTLLKAAELSKTRDKLDAKVVALKKEYDKAIADRDAANEQIVKLLGSTASKPLVTVTTKSVATPAPVAKKAAKKIATKKAKEAPAAEVKAPKAPKEPKVKEPKAPKAPKAEKAPKAPKEEKAPKVPKAPKEEGAKRETMGDKIINMLKGKPKGLAVEEIAKALDKSPSNIYVWHANIGKNQGVIKPEKGFLALAEA